MSPWPLPRSLRPLQDKPKELRLQPPTLTSRCLLFYRPLEWKTLRCVDTGETKASVPGSSPGPAGQRGCTVPQPKGAGATVHPVRHPSLIPHLLPPPGPLSSMAHLKRRPRFATRLPWAVMTAIAQKSLEASLSGPSTGRWPLGVPDFTVSLGNTTSGASV